MLSHEQEEIMEAIWCAGEINSSSLDAVKKRCTIDFSDADLEALEKKGLIIREPIGVVA